MRSVRFQWLLLLLIPLGLLWLCQTTQPFSKTVASHTYATRTLSAVQITNLRVAARYLDGTILQPGDTFSFNRVVGPRTAARGYGLAPSYLEGESPATMGGGICLLSSALYQLALAAGFSVQERKPHLRTIHSVPPGLDATVWYGGADLQFTNTAAMPVRLTAQVQSGNLVLGLQGQRSIPRQPLNRLVSRVSPQALRVTVLRGQQLVSNDLYRLSP